MKKKCPRITKPLRTAASTGKRHYLRSVSQSGLTAPVQLKCTECEKEDTLQRKAGGAASVSHSTESSIRGSLGQGQRLPRNTRSFMESRMGADLSAVNIHDDSHAHQLSRQLAAQAFTIGKDIYFGKGKYAPETSFGRYLLAHELTHVLQQNTGDSGKVRRSVNPARVSCESYPRTYPVFTAIGTDDPVGVIGGADARAIELLTATIDELTLISGNIAGGAAPGEPAFSGCMGQSLRERLLVDSGNAASWTGSGPGTVERLIRIYTNLRNVFQGGFIRYSCLGTDCEAGEDAYIFDGQGYLIHLCRGFWGMGLDDQALTLVHELAHIFYATEDRGFVGMGSSYCLEQFLADMHGIPVPAAYRGACRSDRITLC